jgi:hypothetical protein
VEPCADLGVLLAVAAALGTLHAATVALLIVLLVRQRAIRRSIAAQTILLAVRARGDEDGHGAGAELH